MKKSKSKRILALLLSVLMVLTSVPVVAFTAFAEVGASAITTDPAVAEVETAMQSFQDKMNGKIYRNMSPAYEAYVNCQKALDAYLYGGVTNALAGKAAALNNAVAAIGDEWTAPVFDAQAYYGGNGEVNVATGAYSNIVYASQTTNFSSQTQILGGTGGYYKIAVPNVIVNVYDGVTAPTSPVVFEAWGADNTSQKFDYCASNDSLLGFNKNWQGYMSGNWQKWPADNLTGTDEIGYSSNNKRETTTSLQKKDTGNHKFYWNSLTYLGTGNTNTYYDKIANVKFTANMYRKWNTIKGWATGDASTTHSNYVINYKPVADAIKDCQAKFTTAFSGHNIADYKHGGLSSLMAALDKITVDNINPKNYSYDDSIAESSVQSCAAAIKSFAEAYSAPSAPVVDEAGYQAVRDAMTSIVINYYNNGQNGWTPESWNRFKTAFEAARSMMVAPYNGGSYSATNGNAVATELTAAFKGLDPNDKYADTSALVAVIEKFRSFEAVFTAESYNAALEVINNAINAVWGGADKYGIETQGPIDDEEGNALVAAQAAEVEKAILGLRISPDAAVATTAGRYSLNQVVEYKVENPEWYYNYVDFASAVDEAKKYRNTLAITELTDFNAQYAKYIAEVEKVLDVFFSLEYALTRIPDNTVYGNDNAVAMTTMTAKDQGDQSITPTYTKNAVVIKTTHTPSTVAFGKFNIDYMTNVTNSEGGMDNYKARNIGIDSISIRSTADPVNNNNKANFLSMNSGVGDRLCPQNMSDADKAIYEGRLAYNAFSVSNLKYTGRTNNADPRIRITDAAGNKITDEDVAKNYNLDTVLGVTDGNSSDVNSGYVYGVVFNHSTGGDAHIYIEGDFNVDVTPSKEISSLSRSNVPRRDVKTYEGNFGAVTNHACRATTYCAGRCYFTSASNGETIRPNVEIVDIAYLLDLVKICDELANEKSKYTAESFKAFEDALTAAKANYNYTSHTAAEFVTEAKTRYENLWDAKEALKLADFTVTFNYKNADGTDAVSTFSAEWGSTLEALKAEIEAIATPDYSADGMTNTFKSWSPLLDYSTVIYGDQTYTAVYDSFSAVDWTEYNAAQQIILDKLANNKYYASDLDKVQEITDAMSYFSLTDEEKLRVPSSEQDRIDAEAAQLPAISDMLNAIADSSTYDALVRTVEALNADAYDVAAVQNVMNSIEIGREIVIGGKAYTGYSYDFLINSVMSAMNDNAYKYTITVMDYDENSYYLMRDGSYTQDISLAGQFKYGESVVVTNPVSVNEVCTFEVSITAHNTNTATVNKYVCAATEYQFNVRGNTEILTDAGDKPDYKISFVDGRNNKVVYTYYSSRASVSRFQNVLANIPTVPFYTMTGLRDKATGAEVGMSGTVSLSSKNTVFVVEYGPREESEDYTIILLDADGNQLQKETAKWNQLVELAAPEGTAGLVDTATDKLVAYGSTYSFYACQSITLQATDSVDGKVYVSVANPVSSNGKVYFTGSFAKQDSVPNEDRTVKGYGIVIDTLGYNKNVTLKDVDAANRVFNLAASKLTCGNQFTLYTKAPSVPQNVVYRAYVIYEVNGVELIEYSEPIETILQ